MKKRNSIHESGRSVTTYGFLMSATLQPILRSAELGMQQIDDNNKTTDVLAAIAFLLVSKDY